MSFRKDAKILPPRVGFMADQAAPGERWPLSLPAHEDEAGAWLREFADRDGNEPGLTQPPDPERWRDSQPR